MKLRCFFYRWISLVFFLRRKFALSLLLLLLLLLLLCRNVNRFSHSILLLFFLPILQLDPNECHRPTYIAIGTNHRNSHIVVPNVIKFLFHLTKQKDKKLITIPKIINITDTLLANNQIINCSAKALKELAFEFFFQQNIAPFSYDQQQSPSSPTKDPNVDLNKRELNTQKEVAFSMLLKFVDVSEVNIVTDICGVAYSECFWPRNVRCQMEYISNINTLIAKRHNWFVGVFMDWFVVLETVHSLTFMLIA